MEGFPNPVKSEIQSTPKLLLGNVHFLNYGYLNLDTRMEIENSINLNYMHKCIY